MNGQNIHVFYGLQYVKALESQEAVNLSCQSITSAFFSTDMMRQFISLFTALKSKKEGAK